MARTSSTSKGSRGGGEDVSLERLISDSYLDGDSVERIADIILDSTKPTEESRIYGNESAATRD